MPERCLEWNEFRKIVDRNKASDAIITYYRDDKINPNQVTVFDRNLPRRQGVDKEALLGYGEEDMWRLSQVTSVDNHNGFVPMASSKGSYNKELGKFEVASYRGALDTLQNLRLEGSIRRTPELEELFARHGRYLK